MQSKEKEQQDFRWIPHPVIVTIRNSEDYIRVLLYSYYTTITGWGVLLNETAHPGALGSAVVCEWSSTLRSTLIPNEARTLNMTDENTCLQNRHKVGPLLWFGAPVKQLCPQWSLLRDNKNPLNATSNFQTLNPETQTLTHCNDEADTLDLAT